MTTLITLAIFLGGCWVTVWFWLQVYGHDDYSAGFRAGRYQAGRRDGRRR